MPKMKTSRSAAKRFTVTGSGKFRRRRQGLRHILTKKCAKRRMLLGQGAIVDNTNAKAVRRLMPYAYLNTSLAYDDLRLVKLIIGGIPCV